MKEDAVRSVLVGNIEAIDQGIRLLDCVTDAQYRHLAVPYVRSSIGQHFRHVVDMFLAISNRRDVTLIDYDARRRGAKIETCRETATKELKVVKSWMSDRLVELDQGTLGMLIDVAIKTEVTIEATHSVELRSTMLRELVFTSSHAVHHYALISVIAKIQGVNLEPELGVAPATATFLRQGAAVEDNRPACAP